MSESTNRSMFRQFSNVSNVSYLTGEGTRRPSRMSVDLTLDWDEIAQNMVQTTSKIKSVIDIDHMSNETRARFLMELKAYKKTKERNQLLIIIWWMFTIIAGLVATCVYDFIKEGMYLIWGILFLMNIQMLIVYRIFDKRRFKRLVESFGTPKDELALVIENEANSNTEKKAGY